MSNCVAATADNLAHNGSRLWSYGRMATRSPLLKVGTRFHYPLPTCRLKAPANAEVTRDLWWVASLMTGSPITDGRRDWGTAAKPHHLAIAVATVLASPIALIPEWLVR